MSSGEPLREVYGTRRSFTTRSPKGDILSAKQRIKGREEVFRGLQSLLKLVCCDDSSKVENRVSMC